MNLHDATLTYLTVLNETLRAGEDYRDGTVIFKKMVNRRVEGTVTVLLLQYCIQMSISNTNNYLTCLLKKTFTSLIGMCLYLSALNKVGGKVKPVIYSNSQGKCWQSTSHIQID